MPGGRELCRGEARQHTCTRKWTSLCNHTSNPLKERRWKRTGSRGREIDVLGAHSPLCSSTTHSVIGSSSSWDCVCSSWSSSGGPKRSQAIGSACDTDGGTGMGTSIIKLFCPSIHAKSVATLSSWIQLSIGQNKSSSRQKKQGEKYGMRRIWHMETLRRYLGQ